MILGGGVRDEGENLAREADGVSMVVFGFESFTAGGGDGVSGWD